MLYRLASEADFPAIKSLVDSTGCFPPVDPATLGGHWAVAETGHGEMVATLWFFTEPPQAFVGYWVGRSKTALRLAHFAEQLLREAGVKTVTATIYMANTKSMRLAAAAGMRGGLNYAAFWKEL